MRISVEELTEIINIARDSGLQDTEDRVTESTRALIAENNKLKEKLAQSETSTIRETLAMVRACLKPYLAPAAMDEVFRDLERV